MSIFETYFPNHLVLESSKVQLRMLKSSDEPLFQVITKDPQLWKYFTRELNDPIQLHAWMNDAVFMKSNETRFPFTVIEKETGNICGSTSFGNPSFHDSRIEIGWSWLGSNYIGRDINMHCKFLLLTYAIETMGMERVEIKTDALNERSRAALKKIGASFEGVLRSHMLMPHQRRRNTAYYSILKSEWPAIKALQFAQVN